MAGSTEKIIIQVQVRGQKDLNDLSKGSGRANKSVGGLTKGVAKMAAGLFLAQRAFQAVTSAIKSSISVFTNFEFTMAKVKAVTGATGKDFEQLSKSAQELGRTTFFTAEQVAKLQENFGKLGFTTREILAAQEATIDLATATGSDLARAAIVAGAAIRGFGLDASETKRVVDVMAVSFTSSAMDIEKWQTSMTKVAPIAKSAGFSIEDTAAIMSKLTDSGIEASIAGTSLRNILLKMQDPSSKLTQAFGKTIHGLDDLVPAMKKFVAEGGSMADIMEVVDLRQAAAFEQMLSSTDSILTLRDEMENSNGAAADMAHIIGDTLQGAFLRFKSAVEGLQIVIVEKFGGGLKDVIDKTAKWIVKLSKSGKTLKKIGKVLKLTVKLIASYVVGSKLAVLWTSFMSVGFLGASASAGILSRSLLVLGAGFKVLASAGIGVVVYGLIELAVYFSSAKTEAEKLNEMMDSQGRVISDLIDKKKTLLEIEESAIDSTSAQATAADRLTKAYTDSKTSMEDRVKILNRLKTISEEHFGHLETGITGYDDLRIATDKYKQSLINLAKVEAGKSALTEVESSLIKMKAERENLAVEAKELEYWALQNNISREKLSKLLDLDEKLRDIDIFTWLGVNEEDEQITWLKKRLKSSRKSAALLIEIEEAESLKLNVIDLIEDIDMSALTNIDDLLGDDDDDKGTDFKQTLEIKLKEAQTIVDNARATGLIREDEYNTILLNKKIEATNEFLETVKNGSDDETKALQQLASFKFKLSKENFKTRIKDLEEYYDFEKQLLAQQRADNIISENLYQQELLRLERERLNEKLILYQDNASEISKILADIAKNEAATTILQGDLRRQAISATGELGEALQQLAGDEEKLQGVKKVGIKISQAAAFANNIEALSLQLKGLSASLAEPFPLNIIAVASTLALIVSTISSFRALTGYSGGSGGSGGGGSSSSGSGSGGGDSMMLKTYGGRHTTYAGGGMVYGNSHSNGGEKFSVGGRVVELEGGEAVINKRSTSMFRGQLSAMNSAGGGVQFADGGLLNMPSFAQTQFDVSGQNNIVGALGKGGQVVVVEADITSTQNTVSVIESEASF